MKVAVIDLGSNAVRMTLASVCGKEVKIEKQFRDNVRLSENMSSDNLLKDVPVKRTIEALKKFVFEAESFGAEKIVAVATAAMRKAKNKEVIVNPLREMNINLEIIDGIKEAYYDYVGIMNKTDLKDFVLVDLGGASTEIILVKGGSYKGVTSLPFGAVTLTEKYVNACVPTESPEMYVESMLATVPFINDAQNLPIIALGGTARSFGQIDLNSSDIKGTHIISIEKFKQIYEKVRRMTPDEIRENTPVESKRADIIYAGVAAIYTLANKITAPQIIIDKSGVMEGILYDIAH